MNVTIAGDYAPHAFQTTAHNSRARFLVVAAGVRGGKTYSATVEFLRRIYIDYAAGKGRQPSGIGRRRQPRLLYWVVAPTLDMAKHVYRYVLELMPHELIESISQTDYSIWLKPDILIEFKTAERPERLVGASVAGLLLDEACRIKAETWRGALRGRLTDTKGWAIFASSPLGGQANWVYQEIIARSGVDPDYSAFSWRTVDNPHIDPAEVDAARRQLPEAWFKRDYEADWQSFGGQIFPEFGSAHVLSEREFRLHYGLPNRVDDADLRKLCTRVVAGVDWGFTSPGAIVVVGDMGGGRYVVLEESYASNRPIVGHAQTTWLSEARRLQQRWGVSLFTCDSASSGSISDLQTNGVPVIGAWKDVYLGIRRIAEALHSDGGHPGMVILDRCQNTARELKAYAWKSTKDQSGFGEAPAENQSDHACFAGDTLVLTANGYEPIGALATVNSFDVMAVENGALVRRTAYAFLTKKNATTIAIRYGNEQLRCTADHPLWTQRGWVAAGQIGSSDVIATGYFPDDSGVKRSPVLPERRVLHVLRPKMQVGASRRRASAIARAGMGGGQWARSGRMARTSCQPRQGGQCAVKPSGDVAGRSPQGARRVPRGGEGMALLGGGAGLAFGERQEGVCRAADIGEAMRRMRQDVLQQGHEKDRSVLPLELQDAGVYAKAPWVWQQVSQAKASDSDPEELSLLRRRVSGEIESPEDNVLQQEVLHGCVPDETQDVFNIYIDGPSHAFVANGAVVSNCDALRYALVELRPYATQKTHTTGDHRAPRPIG